MTGNALAAISSMARSCTELPNTALGRVRPTRASAAAFPSSVGTSTISLPMMPAAVATSAARTRSPGMPNGRTPSVTTHLFVELTAHNWAPWEATLHHYHLFAKHVMPIFKKTDRRLLANEAWTRSVRDPLAAKQWDAINAWTAKHHAEREARQGRSSAQA